METFADLPDETPVWIYAFDEQLSSEGETIVRANLDRFIVEWNSHGQPVDGRYSIEEGRFVIVAGHCADAISGCSIDSKVRVFKELHDNFGLNALGGTRVFYRNSEGRIKALDRATFRQLVQDGTIEQQTPVFDLTARTLGDLRSRRMEHAFAGSWAFQAFGSPVPEHKVRRSNVL